MPKGNYKPRRDRRKTQPGGLGGAVLGLYNLTLSSVEAEEGKINIDCVITRMDERSTIFVPVFGMETTINGLGIELAKNGVSVEIAVTSTSPSSFEVQADPLEGEYVLYVPPYIRVMTSQHGLSCMGMMREITACNPNVTEYEVTVTYTPELPSDPVIDVVSVEGTLNNGEFVGFSSFGEVYMRWNDAPGVDKWEVAIPDPVAAPPIPVLMIDSSEEGNRCDPTTGVYNQSEPVWSAVVGLP